jgi:NTP pyrophosphatase (non-canonical NTP hydrolase)
MSSFVAIQKLSKDAKGVEPPRDAIFKLTATVGNFVGFLLRPGIVDDVVEEAYLELIDRLFLVANSCNIDLGNACISKIELNNQKYPPKLCKGRAGKYTEYSKETGIGKETVQESRDLSEEEKANITPVKLQTIISNFAKVRDWDQFHTPRNIYLAMIGELGELAEIFQWKGDDGKADVGLTNFTKEEREKVKQELADVSIYAVRLGELMEIDLKKLSACMTGC